MFRIILSALLDAILERERTSRLDQSYFRKEDSPDETIKKILNPEADELWGALNAALDDEPERELLVIVDGLDKIKHEKSELIKGVRAFAKHLQQRTLKAKLFLTSPPLDEIKEAFGGFPCIEYDKERKG